MFMIMIINIIIIINLIFGRSVGHPIQSVARSGQAGPVEPGQPVSRSAGRSVGGSVESGRLVGSGEVGSGRIDRSLVRQGCVSVLAG